MHLSFSRDFFAIVTALGMRRITQLREYIIVSFLIYFC